MATNFAIEGIEACGGWHMCTVIDALGIRIRVSKRRRHNIKARIGVSHGRHFRFLVLKSRSLSLSSIQCPHSLSLVVL